MKRRRVVRSVLGWGVLSFATLQVVEPVMHGLHLPEWTLTLLVAFVVAGFPVTFVLAWVFDVGPSGIERTPPSGPSPVPVGTPTLAPSARHTLVPTASREPTGRASTRVLYHRTRGSLQPEEGHFRRTFVVGRSPECDVRAREDFVSRQHLKVVLDDGRWCVKDLGSGSGTFVEGKRVDSLPLDDLTEVELGPGGPRFVLTVVPEERMAEEAAPRLPEFRSETEILQRYLGDGSGAPASTQTLLFRRAFQRVQQTSSRRYRLAILVAVLGLLLAGSLLTWQSLRFAALRQRAEAVGR